MLCLDFPLDAVGIEVDLLLRERHAAGLGAILARRAGHEGAPAAADVEEGLVLLQLQLVATAIDVLVLRVLERE